MFNAPRVTSDWAAEMSTIVLHQKSDAHLVANALLAASDEGSVEVLDIISQIIPNAMSVDDPEIPVPLRFDSTAAPILIGALIADRYVFYGRNESNKQTKRIASLIGELTVHSASDLHIPHISRRPLWCRN